MSDYTRADIDKALSQLPLERGDVVFCHSNVGLFGRCDGVKDSDGLCEAFLDAIMRRLGPDGTICVPTFTYSSPNGEVFSLGLPSKMGMFSEWVRKRTQRRSLDPCYSVAAIGPKAPALLDWVAENSFDGQASFWVRFGTTGGVGGKVLNLNFDAGSTYIHYVERDLFVPYRFDKTFLCRMRQDGFNWTVRNTIWVRYLDDALEARFEAFDALAREKGMFKTAQLGRGEMGVISAQDTYNLIKETLPKRPWFLTKAEVMGIEPDSAKFSALR